MTIRWNPLNRQVKSYIIILSNEIYAGMVIVIALTTLLPPFIMKWFYGRYGDRL